jgi:hypothetical protein
MEMDTAYSLLLFVLVFGFPIWLLMFVYVIFRRYDISKLKSLKKKMVKTGHWNEEDIIIIDDTMFYK